MNKTISNLFLIFGLIAIAGCDVVMTPEPLGYEPMELDPSKYDGIWVSKSFIQGGKFISKVDQTKDGMVSIYELDARDDELIVYKCKLLLKKGRKGGDWNFANCLCTEKWCNDEDFTAGDYLFTAFKTGPNEIVFATLNEKGFLAAIENKLLKGAIKNDKTLSLENTSEEIMNFMESHSDKYDLFDWENSVTAKRIFREP